MELQHYFGIQKCSCGDLELPSALQEMEMLTEGNQQVFLRERALSTPVFPSTVKMTACFQGFWWKRPAKRGSSRSQEALHLLPNLRISRASDASTAHQRDTRQHLARC